MLLQHSLIWKLILYEYELCYDTTKTNKNDDYPTPITQHLNNKKTRKVHRTSNTCFLKLPRFIEIMTTEIRRAIDKKGLDIQLAHSGPSLRLYLRKKNNNTITTRTLANCPIRDPNICQNTHTINCLSFLKCHNFKIRSTIRPLHIRIKEHRNTRVSSFHKHLIKCKKKRILIFPLKLKQ